MAAGFAFLAIGGVLLATWWPVWTARIPLWRVGSKRLRFILHPWLGWGLLWAGLGLLNIGREFGGGQYATDADDHPVAVTGVLLCRVGLCLVVAGLLAALWGCVRPLRRFDPSWFNPRVTQSTSAEPVAATANCEGVQAVDPSRSQRPVRTRTGLWESSQPLRLALGCVALTVFSIYAVIDGEDDGARAAGALWLVFLGGGVLIIAVLSVTDRKPVPPRFGSLQDAPQDHGLLFATDRRGQVGVAFASALFAAVGAALVAAVVATDAGTLGIYTLPALLGGLVAMAFFGWFAVVALSSAVWPGGLLLTPSHVQYRAGGGTFTARWDDIDSMELKQTAGSPSLYLHGRDAAALHLTGALRVLAPLQRRLVGAEVAISARAVRAEPSLLARALDRFHRHPQDRRHLASLAAVTFVTELHAAVHGEGASDD